MLKECPECQLPVSDKALSCPHCGYPLKEQVKYKPNSKHKRLPNGFGRITKITGRALRNPYRVTITVGKDSKGAPIGKLLKPKSYFKTYNEAYQALVEYNKDPYDMNNVMTVQSVHDEWVKGYYAKLKSDSARRTEESCWKYCSSVYDLPIKSLKPKHIKYCMENGIAILKGKETTPSADTKVRIKSLFNMLLDYAIEYDYVEKNVSRMFSLTEDIAQEAADKRKEHIAFTNEEMQKLWENVNQIPFVNVLLIQCYMGWRPSEMANLELVNINLENGIIVGGMKTDAGIMRQVPIHPRIFNLVKEQYQKAKELNFPYLIFNQKANEITKFNYDKYSYRFRLVMDELGFGKEHRPHDPRKQFVTACKKYKVDEYAIKYMVGHTIQDITERVYTEREISWLKEEILKIP